MQNLRLRPKIGKMFYIIWIPTVAFLSVMTLISAVELFAFLIMLATDIFTLYFLFTSLVGYVEFDEKILFVKFGFFLKREIPYAKIRSVDLERKFYADSMLSIKNTMEHVNIRYNRFDVISVSVVDNDRLINELKRRMSDISEIMHP